MIDITKIPLPKDASPEVIEYLRKIREIVYANQRDIDALKKQVRR